MNIKKAIVNLYKDESAVTAIEYALIAAAMAAIIIVVMTAGKNVGSGGLTAAVKSIFDKISAALTKFGSAIKP